MFEVANSAAGRWRSRAVAVMAIVAALMIPSACGGDSDGTGDSPSTVNIGVGGAFSFTYLPLYIAQSQGFLDEALEPLGAKAEVTAFNDSVSATKALLNGNVDYVASVVSTMLNAISTGSDLKSIAQYYDTDIVVMIARKGLPTDVASLADMSWGITAFGANNEVSARAVAAAFGLSADDLELTAVGPPSSYQPAIKSGKVDVVLAGEPGASNLIVAGDGVEVLNLFDPAVVERVYGGTYATSSLQSTSDYIADHGELTKALVSAQIEALQWIQEHISDPAAIAAALPEEMRTDTIDAVIKRILPGLSKDGMVQVDALENTVEATKAAGMFDDSVDFDFAEIADNSNRP